MTISREELIELINNLPEEKIKLVSDFVKKISSEDELDEEAYRYVKDKFHKTIKGLRDR